MATHRSKQRDIPSIDQIVRQIGKVDLPRPRLIAIAREQARAARTGSANPRNLMDTVRAQVELATRSKLKAVINGTGIIVHTNFGRSPLALGAAALMTDIASGYCNLEFDLSEGRRGGRGDYLERNLSILCNAESAMVVNNCAAALVLVLMHFASSPERNEVIVSRGELVQIGGGFRIPEILEASGATLREIGTTNRTALGDYSLAIGKRSAMILKVHRSNFFMDGFIASPDSAQIAALAHKRRLVFVEDLGSGAVFETQSLCSGAEREPTPAESIKAGVDLVTFSGDKLLGGPQAGIIAGNAKWIAALKREPLFRALRCDKLILAALQETVDLHLRGEQDLIPIIAMMRQSVDALRERGSRLIELLRDAPVHVALGAAKSQIGGGAMPRTSLASIALEITSANASAMDLAAKLRCGSPPIVGAIERGKLKLDLRTIFPSQDVQVVEAIARL